MLLAKRVALVSSLLTVALVDAVLVLGNRRGADWLFERSADAFAWMMLISSASLSYVLIASGRRLVGALFVLNIVVGAIGATFALGGVTLPTMPLFVADVFWLTLYVSVLTKHWSLVAQ